MTESSGPDRRRFRDEWLRRLVQRHWDLETERIDRWREQGRDFLSQALVDEGIATLEDIGELLSEVYGIEYIDPAPGLLDRDAFGLMPESVVRKYLSLPKALREDTLELLTPNPLDAELLNEVEWVTGREVEPWFSLPERLQALVARELGRSNPVEFDLLRKIETRQEVEVVGGEESVTATGSDVGPPIVRFVNSLIGDAVERRVSDIHIEHERSGSSILYRIDGELRTVMTLPRYVAAGPTVSRIKIMAGMDPAERGRPQEGRAELRVGDREIGLRVSAVPTKWGEDVVLRLRDLEDTGRAGEPGENRLESGPADDRRHATHERESEESDPDGGDAGLAVVVGAGSAERAVLSALASRGFTCETLRSAREALGTVVADEPDAVVVGPETEGMEPVDAIRRIRSVHFDRDLPVLLLARSESGGEEGLTAGADDWLVVPFEQTALEARLRSLLDREPDWPEPEEVMTPPTPYDEEMRLEEVREVGLSDGRYEEAVTDQLERARELFDAPEAFLTSVEEDEQCFGAELGRDADPVPREQSFCAHAILVNDVFVVEDATLDSRFAMNPLVTGEPHIRFYAGCPIHGPRGHRLGALCVVGREPRSVTGEEREALRNLGGEVEEIIAAA